VSDARRWGGRRPSSRPGLGGEQVEGRRAVRELLAARRRRTLDVWLGDTVERTGLIAEIVVLAGAADVPVRRVPRGRLDAEARTDAHQGVLAHAAALAEADLEAMCRAAAHGPRPFLLVVDRVTDPHNLGALLRTAEVGGATGAVLPRHRAAHVTPTVAKAAAGAIEYLPVAIVAGIPSALADLGARGVWTVGLDPSGQRPVHELDLATEPVALVVGAEGEGLSPLCKARCDVLASIPQHGRVGSLNVTAAAAVAVFEIARRRAPDDASAP
jgi:23S rRNA (guanosine2251-2'-O)-methyltransferase